MREIELYELPVVHAGQNVATGAAQGAVGGVIGGGMAGAANAGFGGAVVGAVSGGVAGTAVGAAAGATGSSGGFGAGMAAGAAVGHAATTGMVGPGEVSTSPASPEDNGVIGQAFDGGGGGGKVICTELCRNGAIAHEVWMADIRYSRQNFSEQTMRGYHLWGIPYVKLMRKYPSFAKLAEHPTRWFAEDIAYRMGVLTKPNFKGWVLREVFFRPICFGIGPFAKARDWKSLWRDGVTPAGVRS
jgi:hypothetical protein